MTVATGFGVGSLGLPYMAEKLALTLCFLGVGALATGHSAVRFSTVDD
eukprot:COSAG01_NODE_61085_length_291_cov_0.807292_1_plen_47_part_01